MEIKTPESPPQDILNSRNQTCGATKNKRHRSMTAGQSPYIVLMDSIKINPSSIELHIVNTENNVRLLLQLYGLEQNTARLKINELDPIKQLIGKTDKSITIGLDQNKAVISSRPFRIDFFTDDEPVVSINAQGLLKFEHYRTKQEAPAEPAKEENQDGDEHKDGENPEEGEKKEEEKPEEQKKEEEPGLWEETYKSFHDSKPHGPSSVGIDVGFPGFEHVYGIPEHAESLALKTTKDTDPYRLFNLDVFEYELYNPMALYGSVPVMLAHNEKKTVGIFWQNAAETWIDISSNVADKNFFSKVGEWIKGNTEAPQTDTHWFSESGVIDIFIMLGPKPRDVFKQYAVLTGTTQLPPLFAISYHQCRWNYNDQEDVKNVDANFDKHDIPYDVIWLDIEHTDGKRYFTWDKDRFSNPEDMINNVATKGRKMVTIVDPHLKRDDSFGVYADAKSKDLMVKNKDDGEYEGWCWPGSSSWPDFTNPEVRKWWASKFLVSEYTGSTPNLHVWN
ncbi:hypothetical protein KUTeg_013686 [Tegillarca granosa]|uniref:Glucosidase II subunit alpha n=1 Tax=Tegillarca granosa TaxID=220873 RepID=A0ABQ9EUE9_TEGGR|nr:hypothetical protein KUTeg_013686 [Tegillarca granosa]